MWKWVAMAFAIAIGLAGFMAVLSPPAKPITLPQSKRAAGTDADVRRFSPGSQGAALSD
jgi:hypothetical protein